MKKFLLGLTFLFSLAFAQAQKLNKIYVSDTLIAQLPDRKPDTLALKHYVTFKERDIINIRCDTENFYVVLGDLFDEVNGIKSYEAKLDQYFITANLTYSGGKLVKIKLHDLSGSLTYILNRSEDDPSDSLRIK